MRASEGFWLRARAGAGAGGEVSLRVRLLGASGVEGRERQGWLAYEGALGEGSDVVLRANGDGVEDYVRFAKKPARESLKYEVEMGDVAGLRLVAGVLEFLDAGGYPRLRMQAPWSRGADGRTHTPSIEVEGCAVDTSAAPPWSRPVLPPGAARCGVEIRWGEGATYPLVVDPAWTSTAGLANPRLYPQAATLPDGSVLVVGGRNLQFPNALSEIWKNGVFAASGEMLAMRWYHKLNVLPDGRVLVTGGNNETGDCKPICASAEVWDQGVFKSAGAHLIPRVLHTASSLPDGRVLVVGGQGNSEYAIAQAELWSNGAFSSGGTMVVPRSYHAATTLADGRVLVVSGNPKTGQPVTQAEVWSAGSFAAAGSTPHGLRESTLVGLPDGRALVLGGIGTSGTVCNGSQCKAALLWEAGAFKSAGNMLAARANSQAGLLPGGRVLVVGDSDGAGANRVINAETWGPAGFQGAGDLAPIRLANPALAVLSDGRALLVGGQCDAANCQETALWDPGASDAGDLCKTDIECGAGSCRDGRCCDVFCTDSSKSCVAEKTGLADGVCGPIKNGQACSSGSTCGSAYCVAGLCCDAPCNASNQACSTAKTGKPDGTCGPIKNGIPCNQASECGSGHCSDSVCCDSACDQPGQRCQKNFTGLPSGTCGTVPIGNACSTASGCGSGFCVNGVCCDQACQQAGSSCQQARTDQPSGQCAPVPNGKSCVGGGDCGSGFCADNVCCDSACDQLGFACVEAKTGKTSGLCSAIPDGKACTKPDDCGSGFCVDGVCCDAICDGPCVACSATKKGQGLDGVCGPIKEGLDPKNKCNPFGEGNCAAPGYCDGKGACLSHENEECKAGTCASVDAVIPPSKCNNAGVCVDVTTPVQCGGLKCVDDACLLACKGDADCVSGLSCVGGACKSAGKMERSARSRRTARAVTALKGSAATAPAPSHARAASATRPATPTATASPCLMDKKIQKIPARPRPTRAGPMDSVMAAVSVGATLLKAPTVAPRAARGPSRPLSAATAQANATPSR